MLVSHAAQAREEYEVDANEAQDRRCRGMVVRLTNERENTTLAFEYWNKSLSSREVRKCRGNADGDGDGDGKRVNGSAQGRDEKEMSKSSRPERLERLTG